MLKLLQGWKGVLILLLYAGSGAYGMVTGKNVTPVVDEVVKAAGEQPADEGTLKLALNLGALGLALWEIYGKAAEAYRQKRAGATTKELLSPEGHVKEAIAAGVIPVATPITATADAVPVAVVEKVKALEEEAKG